MSFYELHSLNNRATPTQMCQYKLALAMFTLFNTQEPTMDWLDMNFQQTFNQRYNFLNFVNTASYKVGSNILCNRFACLNKKIEHDWLNLTKESFKIKCKALFFPKTTLPLGMPNWESKLLLCVVLLFYHYTVVLFMFLLMFYCALFFIKYWYLLSGE